MKKSKPEPKAAKAKKAARVKAGQPKGGQVARSPYQTINPRTGVFDPPGQVGQPQPPSPSVPPPAPPMMPPQPPAGGTPPPQPQMQPQTIGNAAVRAGQQTTPRQFDQSYAQNLSTFAGGQLQPPSNGQLSFNPFSNNAFQGTGLPSGGGNAPLYGQPQSLLQTAMQRNLSNGYLTTTPQSQQAMTTTTPSQVNLSTPATPATPSF